MSKINLAPDASGTGIFTIASPNSNTNRTLTLPDDTGTIVTNSGNQAGSFTTLTTSGNVGIGTSSPSFPLDVVSNSSSNALQLRGRSSDNVSRFELRSNDAATAYGAIYAYNNVLGIEAPQASGTVRLYTNATERMRIDSGGNVLVGKTSLSQSTVGTQMYAGGPTEITTDGNRGILINRKTSDGQLIAFDQDGITEGQITVSGNTVSYLGGNLARWAQTLSAKDESLKKGTVLSNLDEMNVYVKPTLYWTEEDELPVDEEGNPTVAVGDVKQETSVSDNEQLNKVKVSDVEGDPNVAGVFVNWDYDEAHEVDEIVMAMTGDMIIRITEGVTVARGDLLMSAGDGTAKPQGDDIVRSKTIAKVTSTHVTCTYDDGSYCVPCVLMAC